MARQHSPNRDAVQSKNKKPSRSCGTAPGYDWLLVKSERFQCRPIDCSGHGQAVIALVTGERGAGVRADETVHLIIIITLCLKRGLDVHDHLAGIEVVVAVDRLVVSISAVTRIVSVGRVPVTVVPIVIAPGEKRDAGITAPPPAAIVVMAIKPAPRLLIGEGVGPVAILPVAICGRVVLPIAIPDGGVRARLDVRVR